MAFTTVNGSDGAVSLVGSTGVDTATLVALNSNVFVGGNTGNDTLISAAATGNGNLTDFTVRMGGGDDGVVLGDNLLNSTISLDGTTLANDGNDVFNNVGNAMVNSELLGLGGNDIIGLGGLQSSVVNGNAGNDVINNFAVGGSANTATTISSSTILGGQGVDTINLAADGSGMELNGNRGNDQVTLSGGAQGSIAATTLFGGQGDDAVTLLNNNIDGNTLSGDLGSDTLSGAASNDILLGGAAADSLISAAGADTLSGGDGVDIFTIGTGTATNLNGTVDNFATITDLANAGANAETLVFDVANTAGSSAGVGALGTVATTSATDLFSNLTGSSFDGTNTLATITLVAGAAGAQFAGTYILVQDGASGADAFAATDIAVAASTANLNAANVQFV